MRDLISLGDLMRLFLESDPNSIIRRPNLRRFARDNDIRYIITDGKWLIDYKQFFKKINPRRISEPAKMPRLRCLRDCVTQFNNDYPNRKIDKATVSKYIKSKTVTRYFHGNTWFINYDELEKVILRHLKAIKKRKKKIQLNIDKGLVGLPIRPF